MGSDVLRGGVGKDVAVRVDEAGEHGVVGQVGHGNAFGCGIGDRLNAVSSDEDVGVGADISGAHVDELSGKNGLGDGGRSRLLGQCRTCQNKEGGTKQKSSLHVGSNITLEGRIHQGSCAHKVH